MSLALTPIDELIDEIFRRCESGLIVMERIVDPSDPAVMLRYSGGGTSAIGLAVVAKKTLCREICDSLESGES